MTPVQQLRVDLEATAVKWAEAVANENRAAESVAMRRLDALLDKWWLVAERPSPKRSSHL